MLKRNADTISDEIFFRDKLRQLLELRDKTITLSFKNPIHKIKLKELNAEIDEIKQKISETEYSSIDSKAFLSGKKSVLISNDRPLVFVLKSFFLHNSCECTTFDNMAFAQNTILGSDFSFILLDTTSTDLKNSESSALNRIVSRHENIIRVISKDATIPKASAQHTLKKPVLIDKLMEVLLNSKK